MMKVNHLVHVHRHIEQLHEVCDNLRWLLFHRVRQLTNCHQIRDCHLTNNRRELYGSNRRPLLVLNHGLRGINEVFATFRQQITALLVIIIHFIRDVFEQPNESAQAQPASGIRHANRGA
jgi:hypothetical protein